MRDGQEAVWTSGIDKRPITGRRRLEPLGLEGDAQADLKNHGGKDKAVCCYAADHYDGWRKTLGLDAAAFPFGAFGENFTIVGLPEDAVCIGDIYTVGTAHVQISQPRMPCYKLGRLWNLPDLPHTVKDSGKTGYYLRVLEPGDVGPGDPLTLIERPLPQWSVTRINDAMYVRKDDEALAYELGRLPLLAEAWRSPFRRRAGLIRYRADTAQ
jgi:MOSC domain-containing protein YiiM